MNPLIAYVLLIGSIAAGRHVARGVVQYARKLVNKVPMGALMEVAHGLAGPLKLAAMEIYRLEEYMRQAAAAITAARCKKGDETVVRPTAITTTSVEDVAK